MALSESCSILQERDVDANKRIDEILRRGTSDGQCLERIHLRVWMDEEKDEPTDAAAVAAMAHELDSSGSGGVVLHILWGLEERKAWLCVRKGVRDVSSA